MGAPVIASPSFTAGIKTEFLRTYFRKYEGIRDALQKVMRLGLPSDKNQETYFHWESAPHVKRWIRGTTMPSKNFRGISYTATNYEWARSIPWHFADEQDDQTKSLPEAARELGKSFAILEERVFFQILTGSTDFDLLPSVPTAADGGNLFATTVSGSNRFGASSGNSLTGTGTSQSQIETDFFSVMAQFRLFQDTEGQPLWDRGTLDGPVTIFFAAGGALELAFSAVFQREITHSVISSTGAGVSNVIKARGHQVRLVPTQRLTGNSWYAILEEADVKPIFSQLRQAPTEINWNMDNSDATRKTGYKEMGFYGRMGFGVATPYSAIKVTNS